MNATEERFSSRGVGADSTPGCFVCGGPTGLHSNISGFVESKESGERVEGMFETGARLDFRSYEPEWIQVKIGACKEHEANLQALHRLTYQAGGLISRGIIAIAKAEEPPKQARPDREAEFDAGRRWQGEKTQ